MRINISSWLVERRIPRFQRRECQIHLMSNKRGCIESHKPAVHQELPDNAVDEDDEPAFSFMATGMGWQNVIVESEVIGIIYSTNEGWELENGDVFATREEAAEALFNQTPSAA